MSIKQEIIELIEEDQWHGVSAKHTVDKIFSILKINESDYCIHDFQISVFKDDIVCTKCGISTYLQ